MSDRQFKFPLCGDITSFGVEELFTWTEQMSCVYHGRTKGEGCGHIKSI